LKRFPGKQTNKKASFTLAECKGDKQEYDCFFANKIISIFSSVQLDKNELPIAVVENCFTDCREKTN
jgi:hypothetical protein